MFGWLFGGKRRQYVPRREFDEVVLAQMRFNHYLKGKVLQMALDLTKLQTAVAKLEAAANAPSPQQGEVDTLAGRVDAVAEQLNPTPAPTT